VELLIRVPFSGYWTLFLPTADRFAGAKSVVSFLRFEIVNLTVKVDFSNLKTSRWYEIAIRFAAGGLITALVGIIAMEFGPRVGGLFLAFPSIFPAAATLIEKHEQRKKRRMGLAGGSAGSRQPALMLPAPRSEASACSLSR
jgi:hypothetical protein